MSPTRNSLVALLVAIVTVAAAVTPGEALTISPTSALLIGISDDNSANLAFTAPPWIPQNGFTGFPLLIDPDDSLYKNNVDSGEENKPFKDSYNTAYSPDPNDPENALISYVAGMPVISCGACYLVVKDGNHDPAQYLFDISSWNGTENLEINGFWPNQGAISYVAIYSGPTRVPEPGTLAVALFGLAGVVFGRRRLSVKK